MLEARTSRHRRAFDAWNEVPLVPQSTGMSCWAAAAAMIIGWRDVVDVDPADVASGAGRWSEYRAGLHPRDLADFARAWGFTVVPRADWSIATMRSLLERFGPVWLGEASPGLHSIVVTGMYGDGEEEGTWVRVNDPWPLGRGERYTLAWPQLTRNFRAATTLGGADVQILHAGGRRGGPSGHYRFEEKRVTHSTLQRLPASEDDTMDTPDRTWHHEDYPTNGRQLSVYAATALAGGTEYVDTSPDTPDPLAGHGGTGKNLCLMWTPFDSVPTSIDVVVHLHGYSSLAPDDGFLHAKVTASGADLSSRARPTLAIIPRGRKIRADELAAAPNANPGRYTFPALTSGNGKGLENLIGYGLRYFRTKVLGGDGPDPSVDRLILTAHSGGGAALNALLASHATCAVCNPHEVHVFDALYGDVKGVLSWVAARLARDRALAAEDLSALGGGLRIVYRDGTAKASSSVQAALPGPDDALHAAYRTDATTADHTKVAAVHGPILLGSVRADLGPGAAAQGIHTHPGVYGAPTGLMELYRNDPPAPAVHTRGLDRPSPDPYVVPDPSSYKGKGIGDFVRHWIEWFKKFARWRAGVPHSAYPYFPHSAICELEVSGGGGRGYGTGFFVGPNKLLTCGHNFKSGSFTASRIVVRPGKSPVQSIFPEKAFSVSWMDHVHPKWAASEDMDFDLAVLNTPGLDAPDGNYFDLPNMTPAQTEQMVVCGYGKMQGDTTPDSEEGQYLDGGTITHATAEQYHFPIQSIPGHSGSPVFWGQMVVAVLTGPRMITATTISDYENRGVRLTPDKNDWIRSK